MTLTLIAMGAITFLLSGYTQYKIWQLNNAQQANQQWYQPASQASLQLSRALNESVVILGAYLEKGQANDYSQWQAIWQQDVATALQTMQDLQQSKFEAVGEMPRKEVQGLWRKLKVSTEQLQEKQALLAQRVKDELGETGYYTQLMYEQQGSYVVMEGTRDFATLQATYKRLKNQYNAQLLPLLTAANQQAATLQTNIKNHATPLNGQMQNYQANMRWAGWLAMAVCVILGIILGISLIRFVVENMRFLGRPLKALSRGELPEPLQKKRNETDVLASHMNTLVNHMHHVRQLALEVGNGHFNNDVDAFNKKGALGLSLAEMQTSLGQVSKDNEVRRWTNEGHKLFADLMRQYSHSMQELAEQVIHHMVKYTNASQGALFLVQEANTEKAHLKLVSAYALGRKKALKKTLQLGEGLAGQAWREKDTLTITDVPEAYTHIKSGLGHATPTQLLIVPLIFNEEVVGVIELASFEVLPAHVVDFIEKTSESIANTFATTQQTERTRDLLKESQVKTEMLGAHEEEMRQNMEELQATQEEMRRQQQALAKNEQSLDALINNTSDTIFALDRNYCITVVNQTLYKKYKSLGVDLKKGTPIYDVLPESKWDVWKARYDRALAGESYSIMEESRDESGTMVYRQTYHNPIRNEQDEVVGVSVISRDVSELMHMQEEARKQENTLKAVINNTTDTFFAIDPQYCILVANESLKARFRSSNIDLKAGTNILALLPEAARNEWKERYDRALGGESFSFMQERQTDDKTLYLEVFCNPIKDENEQIIGATVISRDMTEWRTALAEKDSREQELRKLRNAMGLDNESPEERVKQGKTRRKVNQQAVEQTVQVKE